MKNMSHALSLMGGAPPRSVLRGLPLSRNRNAKRHRKKREKEDSRVVERRGLDIAQGQSRAELKEEVGSVKCQIKNYSWPHTPNPWGHVELVKILKRISITRKLLADEFLLLSSHVPHSVTCEASHIR